MCVCKGAKIGQHFAFSMLKRTMAWKKYTIAASGQYQLKIIPIWFWAFILDLLTLLGNASWKWNLFLILSWNLNIKKVSWDPPVSDVTFLDKGGQLGHPINDATFLDQRSSCNNTLARGGKGGNRCLAEEGGHVSHLSPALYGLIYSTKKLTQDGAVILEIIKALEGISVRHMCYKGVYRKIPSLVSLLIILFDRAGVSILPGSIRCNFHYTPTTLSQYCPGWRYVLEITPKMAG